MAEVLLMALDIEGMEMMEEASASSDEDTDLRDLIERVILDD
jgi:hypothetical protein